MRCVALLLLLLSTLMAQAQAPSDPAAMPEGDAERGRLVFGQCRTCHYP